MSIKYVKTAADKVREKDDLNRNPIMRFLRNQEHLKFKVGDILIKQQKYYGSGADVQWKTETTSGVNVPTKYMYVFENELGIGYIKQLKVDGSGLTNSLVCAANFDPEETRFALDPDYADHLLMSDGEEYQYNKEYAARKAFREDALDKNKQLLISTGAVKKLNAWFDSLKTGDEFWWGYNIEDMVKTKWVITNTGYTNPAHKNITIRCVTAAYPHHIGRTQTYTVAAFQKAKLTMSQPYPLEDGLCGPQK